jgi:hypothetical protein
MASAWRPPQLQVSITGIWQLDDFFRPNYMPRESFVDL